MLDWTGAPSQYRRQQVLASLDLDHLLLLHGCVATTNKDMLKFCFCISTKSFGLLKFKTDLGYGWVGEAEVMKGVEGGVAGGVEVGGEGEGGWQVGEERGG